MKKKFYKVLSLILSVTLLLSVCFVSGAFNVSAAATGSTREYYVRYDGAEYAETDVYGTNGTVSNPYKTVYDVVAAVNADSAFNVEGNTFKVWIMQDIAAPANTGTVTVGSVNYATHNMTSWAKNNTGNTMMAHNATMVIKPYSGNHANNTSVKTTYLAMSTLVGAYDQMEFRGPTQLDDITLVMMASDYTSNVVNGRINLNGNNVKFGLNVTQAYVNVKRSGATAWAGGASTIITRNTITTDIYNVCTGDTPTVVNKEVNVEFENYVSGINGYIGLPAIGGHTNTVFNENVTVGFTGASNAGRLSLGWDGSSYPVTLKKNLNLRFTGTTSNFRIARSGTMIVEGGLHVIKTSSFKSDSGHLDYATLKGFVYTSTEKTANPDTWLINVDSVAKDRIDFHGEKGKFQVPAGAFATATNKADGSTVESDANGILDLSSKPGEYDVQVIQVKPKVYTYYVQGGGTGDGTSLANPAPDVATVISYINDCRLTAEETATIYIVQDIDKPALLTSGSKVHNMAAWGGTVSHEAKIVIKPHSSNAANYNDTVKTTYLASSKNVGDSSIFFKMGGPTEFQDLMLVFSYGTWNGHILEDRNIMVANGNDLTIGENVTYGNIHSTSADNSISSWATSGTIDTWDTLGFSAGDPGVNYFDSFKITIKDTNSYSSARIDVPGRNAGTYNFKGDVTLEFQNDQYGTSIRLGTKETGATTVIEKNLNVKFTDGRSLRFNPDGLTSNVTVNGAFQLIESTDCSYQLSGNDYDPIRTNYGSNLKGKDGNAVPYYRLTVDAQYVDYIDFVEGETGKFVNTHPSLIAVATDENGNETPSIDGLIDLSKVTGNYTVKFVEYYTNNGQQISIYKDTTIDLSKVTHNEMPGYAFIGWKLKNQDGSLSTVGVKPSLKRGDILSAQYLELGTDFAIEETAQIRDDGEQGKGTLRFIINKSHEFSSYVPNAGEFGTILFATDATRGNEIYYDEKVILEWIYDENQEGLYGSHFVPGKGGSSSDKYETENKPVIVLANNILEENDTTLKYSACITDIPEEDYYTWYTARGFIKFTDYNGIDRILYTEQAQSCMYKVAAETDAADLTTAEQNVIDYIDNHHTVAEYDKLYEKTYTYGADQNGNITDPNRVIYKQNGLYVRDVAIDVDTIGSGADPYEICFITDSHFNVLSTNDILNGSKYILGSYRGRYYYTYRRAYIVNQLAYASRFDKVVFGGDQLDYLSDGNLTAVDRMITKKSINGSVKMVLGNHESAEFCQPVDVVNAHEVLTLEEKYAQIQNYWANDTYIDYEIVKNKQGKAIAMMIYLDNSDEQYWQIQLDTLPVYFAEARAAGVPVFIYQHIPMLTMNPDETEVWYSGYEGTFAMNESESKNGDKVDYTSANGYLGDANSTQLTKNVCELIRKNADIVKGVFCGHTHENAYTEIVGLNPDGTANNLRIPQHNGFAGHRNGVMKITLK